VILISAINAEKTSLSASAAVVKIVQNVEMRLIIVSAKMMKKKRYKKIPIVSIKEVIMMMMKMKMKI